MSNTFRPPFTARSFDRTGAQLAVRPIPRPRDAASAFAAAVRQAPEETATFALHDADGLFVQVGAIPGEPLRALHDTTSMAFSENGVDLLTGHRSGAIRLWNLATGERVWKHTEADDPIMGLAFAEGKPWFVAWCDDGPLMVIDRATGEVTTRIDVPQFGSFTAVLSPDASEVTLTGAAVHRFALPGGEPLTGLDNDIIEHDERTLNLGGEPRTLWVGHTGAGSTFVGAHVSPSVDEVVFWDAETGRRLTSIIGFASISACDLSSDGITMAVGMAREDEPMAVHLIDIPSRTLRNTIDVHGSGFVDLRFTPDSAHLIVHAVDAGVQRFDAMTGALLDTFAEVDPSLFVVQPAEMHGTAWDETAPMMVTHDEHTGLIELTTLVSRGPFGPLGRACSNDGRFYATVAQATDEHVVLLYDFVRRTVIASFAHDGAVQEIWMSGDAKRLVVRARDQVMVWTLPAARSW